MDKRRWLLVALAVGLVVLAWRLGVFELVRDPAQLRVILLGLGHWGYVAFIAAFAFLQPLGVPGIAFVIGAAAVWPAPVAFALSVIGSMIASTIGFSFARYVARDWVDAKLPARLRVYSARLETHGFVTVVILRIIFLMNPFLHGLFGVSKLRFWTHFWASLLGYVPSLAIVTFVGAEGIELLRKHPDKAPYAIGVVVVGICLYALHRRTRRVT